MFKRSLKKSTLITCESSWLLRDLYFQVDWSVRKKKPRIIGMEQLTEDCVCLRCHVLSLKDCGLLSDNLLRVCELDSSLQLKCLCFIGQASSAKLASRSKRPGLCWDRPALTGGALPGCRGECRRQRALLCRRETRRFIILFIIFCFHRLTSPHNEAITSYMSASPDLHDADNDAVVCKQLLMFSSSLFDFTVT